MNPSGSLRVYNLIPKLCRFPFMYCQNKSLLLHKTIPSSEESSFRHRRITKNLSVHVLYEKGQIV